MKSILTHNFIKTLLVAVIALGGAIFVIAANAADNSVVRRPYTDFMGGSNPCDFSLNVYFTNPAWNNFGSIDNPAGTPGFVVITWPVFYDFINNTLFAGPHFCETPGSWDGMIRERFLKEKGCEIEDPYGLVCPYEETINETGTGVGFSIYSTDEVSTWFNSGEPHDLSQACWDGTSPATNFPCSILDGSMDVSVLLKIGLDSINTGAPPAAPMELGNTFSITEMLQGRGFGTFTDHASAFGFTPGTKGMVTEGVNFLLDTTFKSNINSRLWDARDGFANFAQPQAVVDVREAP